MNSYDELRRSPAFSRLESAIAILVEREFSRAAVTFNVDELTLNIARDDGQVISVAYNYPPYAFVAIQSLKGYEANLDSRHQQMVDLIGAFLRHETAAILRHGKSTGEGTLLVTPKREPAWKLAFPGE